MTVPIPAAGADVLPPQDAAFGLFVTNFASAWVPATFNVVVPSAASLVTLASTFNTALATATDPATRTPVTVSQKDDDRATAAIAFRAAIRAAQAAFLAGTATEAELNVLGVRANSLIRSPIGAPIFAPIISVDGTSVGLVRFRVTQVNPATGVAVTTRGFSAGITGIEMQRRVGSGDYLLRFSAKRTKVFDNVADLSPGTIAQYRARYVTARGLSSPWSSVVSGVAT